MKRFITALAALAALSAPAMAAEGEAHAPEEHDWSWEGAFGEYGRETRREWQRGFLVFQQVCASCHSLEQISFRNLGQPGGPFEYIPDPEHEGEYLTWDNPNDNPVVMAIAAEYMIMDGPDDAGDMFERAGVPADRFPSPFANPQQAAASNGGAIPPDLSVIVKARAGGAEYVRSLLLGYSDEVPHDVTLLPGQHYNEYFPGGVLAMAAPLSDGIVSYPDGSPETVEQYAHDVTSFLAWTAEPHMEDRKRMGLAVMMFLLIFSILLWLAYRQVWANVKH